MAALKAAGHDVDLLYDPGLDNNFHFRIRGAERLSRRDALLRQAEAFEPDLVATSCITSLYPYVRDIAGALRDRLGVPTIVGGPHAAALPELVLRDGAFDFVGVGECEQALVELADRLERGDDPRDVANLGFLDGEGPNARFVLNEPRPRVEDLDKIAWPERDLWASRAGFRFRELMIMGSRGCHFRCDFCMNAYNLSLYGTSKSSIRRRSPENVIAEIESVRERYDTRFIFFYDDDLTSDGAWLEAFAKLYGREVGLPFYCHGTNNTLDASKARLLKEAGCRQLFMGIDSGDPGVRSDVLNRHFTNADVAEKARMVRAAGIDLQVSAIFGIPFETPEDMRRTVEFVDEGGPAVVATYSCYPFPGTPIVDAARRAGILSPEAERRMQRGEGSLHSRSILDHPHAEVAWACANLLPAYTKAPRWLKRPLLAFMLRGERLWLARLVFLAMIPVTTPLFGLTRLRALVRQLRRVVTLSAAERLGLAPSS